MKTIRDFNLENKKVIIRVDFNVPLKVEIEKGEPRERFSFFYKMEFLGENFFEKKFSPNPFQKTSNWIK